MRGLTTGNNLVLPKVQLSAQNVGPETSAPQKVFLNIYDLHSTNNYLYPIGTGFYHSGTANLKSYIIIIFIEYAIL